MSEHDRDLTEAIRHEIISPESVKHMLDIWREMPLEHPEWNERKRIWFLLASASHEATETVLARRRREAARTGPWDAPAAEGREHCARHFEALAVAIRDHGPKTAEGVLTAMAGAHFGALLDAAAAARAGYPGSLQWGDYEEEDGYPGSLLPKRGTP